MPLTTIFTHHVGGVPERRVNSDSVVEKTSSRVLRDVYYIILDGYARQDVLKEIYGHDNEPFLKELERRGFFVARKSRANYMFTGVSLASSLNMTHLNDLVRQFIPRSPKDKSFDHQLIRTNLVMREFKRRGYKIVSVASGYSVTHMNEQADVIFDDGQDEFMDILLKTTVASPFLKPFLLSGHRHQILFNLEALKKCPTLASPKFVFAHFICPHFPYVFKRNGEEAPLPKRRTTYAEDWALLDPYLDQVIYLNGQILTIIDKLRAGSPVEPVIILQSDHGPAPHGFPYPPTEIAAHERSANLLAVRFPEKEKSLGNDSMTPVNIFRLVFNNYFGAQFALLEDKVNYSEYSHPYDFIDITEFCRLKDQGRPARITDMDPRSDGSGKSSSH